MGLAKKATAENLPEGTRDFRGGQAATEAAPAQAAASGPDAAIERLKAARVKPATPAFKQRDFDAEARGKTRCVQFEAALMSPAIAGLRFDNLEQYLALVKQAAEAGVKYTFGD